MASSTGRLEGKVALITGGGSGIGLAWASAFVQDGANVLIMGRNLEKLEQAVKHLQSLVKDTGELRDTRVSFHQGDVGNEDDVAAAVAKASIDDCLDITVANAGIGGLSPILATDADKWDQIMQTNLSGTFYTIKHAGIKMSRSGGGAICAISSIAGIKTHQYMAPYCVSKAGIDMLVRN